MRDHMLKLEAKIAALEVENRRDKELLQRLLDADPDPPDVDLSHTQLLAPMTPIAGAQVQVIELVHRLG